MRKTVLITGVSGGIGKELADRFAKGGHHIVLVARSESKIVELAQEYRKKYGIQATRASPRMWPHQGFLLRKSSQSSRRRGLPLTILVNNAGFGLSGPFMETDMEQEVNMIDVNIKALTVMTKLFLPDMIKRGQGGVMNVASLVGFFPGPMMSVYYATKAYVLSFTEALANEVSGTGVTVTALCPGLTSTGFVDRSGMGAVK